jgi:chromosome segregation ATPase
MEFKETSSQSSKLSRLNGIIEKAYQIETYLSAQKSFVEKVSAEFIKKHTELEEIKKELPLLLKSITVKGEIDNQLIKTIDSLQDLIHRETEEKQKVFGTVKNLQILEIPSQETELKEIKDRIKSAHPELRQKLLALDKINQEISTENEKLQELTNQMELINKSCAEYKTVYQEMLDEMSSLDNRLPAQLEEKQRILDNIKQLETTEMLQQEANLREIKAQIESLQPELNRRKDSVDIINQEITGINKKLEGLLLELQTLKQRYDEQVALYGGMPKEMASLDIMLLSKTQERERLANKIQNLETVELPEQEKKMEEIKNEIRQMQNEIRQKQEPLARLTQEIPQELQKLRELERKEDVLRREYLSLESNRQELGRALSQLDEQIEKKKAERDKLMQWDSQVGSGIKQYSELKEKTKETSRLLLDELHRKEQMYGQVSPVVAPVRKTYYQEPSQTPKKPSETSIPVQVLRTIFMIALMLFMLAILGLLIWGLLSLK